MKISVVIPTYNRAKVVGEAIESVLAQTYKDFELVVLDDGSTDETRNRVQPYLVDSRVRYFYQENAGVSAARNAGVKIASGEFVSFLDSDDLWKPNMLESVVMFIERHPGMQAIFTDLEAYRGGKFIPSTIRCTEIFSKLLADASYPDSFVIDKRDMFLILLQEVPVKPTSFIILREAFERVGGFDTTYVSGEDWEFYLRLSKYVDFGYIDMSLAVLRVTENSLHLMEMELDLLGVLGFLLDTKKTLDDDVEALEAVRSGIKDTAIRLSWYYINTNRKVDAIRACFKGYRETRDLEMLLRAGAVVLPESIKDWLRPKRRRTKEAKESVESVACDSSRF